MIFKFPYPVDLSKSVMGNRTEKTKYRAGNVNVLDYISEDDILKAKNIVVYDGESLVWYKGRSKIPTNVFFQYVDRDSQVSSDEYNKNICISVKDCPVWKFSDLTSDFQRKKGDRYLKATLEEICSEMQLLEVVAGMCVMYGVNIKIHTIRDNDTYGVVIDTDNEVLRDEVIFNIQSKVKYIHNKYGIWFDVVNVEKSTKENVVPSPLDWDW